jgi:hypothetical protein
MNVIYRHQNALELTRTKACVLLQMKRFMPAVQDMSCDIAVHQQPPGGIHTHTNCVRYWLHYLQLACRVSLT